MFCCHWFMIEFLLAHFTSLSFIAFLILWNVVLIFLFIVICNTSVHIVWKNVTTRYYYYLFLSNQKCIFISNSNLCALLHVKQHFTTAFFTMMTILEFYYKLHGSNKICCHFNKRHLWHLHVHLLVFVCSQHVYCQGYSEEHWTVM